MVRRLRADQRRRSARTARPRSGSGDGRVVMADRNAGLIRISANGVVLEGNLLLPPNARGVVLFAHGSGSSRFSSRNRYVAEQLREKGLGTLLIDLLTAEEEQIDMRTAHLRFDIELLAE